MTELPVTRWRIVGLPGVPGVEELQVLVLVDTVAPIIVDVIERAARDAGVELIRLEDDQ